MAKKAGKAVSVRDRGKPSREEIMKQYEFLLDISDTYLSMIDRDYTYLITNEAFCKALNMEKKEVMGNTPMRIWGRETFQKIIKPYLDKSFESKEIRYTRWFEVPEKGARFFEVTFRPHLDDCGEVDFVLVSSRDLTDQENARRRLQEQQQDLDLVNTVNQLYSEGRDEVQITTTIVKKIVDLFGAFAANIFLTDDLSSRLRPLNSFFPGKTDPKESLLMANDVIKGFGKGSYFRYILDRKKIVHITRPEMIRRVIRELTDDQQAYESLMKLVERYAVSSMLVIPLLKNNDSLGLLGITRDKPFSEEEIERIKKLGYQIIVVLKRIKEEKRLKENERSLEEAQRISMLGDWSWNLKTDEVRWSGEFFRILGYHPRRDKPSFSLLLRRIHPEDRKKVRDKITGAVRECKRRCSDQFRLLMPDGSVKYISSTGILEYVDDQPARWHGTIHDITSLKKAEQQLLRQTRELSLINRLNLELNKGTSLEKIIRIFERMIKKIYPVKFFFVYLREPFDDEFHIAFNNVSEEIKTTLGNNGGGTIFRTVPVKGFQQFLERMTQKDPLILINSLEEIESSMDLMFPGDERKQNAMNILRKTGLRSLLFYPIMSGDKLLGYLNLDSEESLGRDILSNLSSILEQVVMVFLKKIGEDEMRRLYNAIERLNEVLIISDRAGRILYINRAVQKILGYEREGLVGEDIRSMRYREQDPAFYENIWDTVLSGRSWSGIHRLQHRDGGIIKLRSNITPIQDDQGQILYYVTIMQDITKEAAMELYMQRTQKLEMMGRFAGGLAHDFNNILATIMGYIEMVMDGEERDSYNYKYLDKARMSGKKAEEVIRKLLTFNRGMDPEMELVGMYDLIRDIFALLKPQIPGHVRTDIEDHSNGKKVMADPAQMRQVFLNLLSNALYAVRNKKDGLVRVTMEVGEASGERARKYPELEKGKWLCVKIEDNGDGIPAEALDKVFDPFYTTKPVGEGSGMGLSVVHGIIRNHHGVIHLESDPGKGTVFTVFLPVEE